METTIMMLMMPTVMESLVTVVDAASMLGMRRRPMEGIMFKAFTMLLDGTRVVEVAAIMMVSIAVAVVNWHTASILGGVTIIMMERILMMNISRTVLVVITMM